MRRRYAVCFTVFSVAILFLILAYFLRFAHSGRSVLDPMQADAYGMFLVHYPIALWLQYWLFDFNLPATVKATHRIRADGRVQLGADPRVAANSRREKGALVAHVSWFLSVKTKVLEFGGYRVELMRGPRSGMACLGFRQIEIAQLCSVCVSLLNQRDNDQLNHPAACPVGPKSN